MVLSTLSARLGMGGSRMIVKAVSDGGGVGGFSKIRRFSAGARTRSLERMAGGPAELGAWYLAAYFGGLAVFVWAACGLRSMGDSRAEERRRSRKARYDDFKDEVPQFGDQYFGDRWPAADDGKIAELSKEISLLGGALSRWNRGIGELSVGLSRCDSKPEIARVRQQPLHSGTADEVLEISKKCDYVVEEKAAELSRWRAAADEKLAELNREIMEVRRTIRKGNEL